VKSGLCQPAEDLKAKKNLLCNDAETNETYLVLAWGCIGLECKIVLLSHAFELSSDLLWYDQGAACQQNSEQYPEIWWRHIPIISSQHNGVQLELVCIEAHNRFAKSALSTDCESQERGVITGIKM